MADWMDELERLAELRDKGLITEDEFEVKRQEMLNSPSEITGENPSEGKTITSSPPNRVRFGSGYFRF
jgi:hypothetical protein